MTSLDRNQMELSAKADWSIQLSSTEYIQKLRRLN